MSASAEELDPGPNDSLGEPTISTDGGNVYTVCITITNSGGDCSGPNGEVQTGFGEGDCIEVELDITLMSPGSGGYSIPIIGGGRQGTGQIATTISASQDFCAC